MELYKYKLLISLASGWIALLFSKYSIEIDHVKIVWSMIFPLIIVLIWEYEYAIITGVGGLAIFIPFYIYPDRGYGNILTTLLYFVLFIVDAKLIKESDIKKSSLKIYLIHIVYGIFFVVANSSFYFKILSLNPEGYEEPIRRVMTNSSLAIQNINFICTVIMLTAVGRVLLRLPSIRQFYQLEQVANSEENYKIIIKTILLLIGFALVNLLANALYASSMGTYNVAELFEFNTAGMVKTMLIISVAFVVCDYAIYSAMIEKEAINRSKKSEIEIKKLNEGLEKAVAERTQELKRAYDDLESFSYMVSHEIKTPIREIEAYISIIEEDNQENLNRTSLDDIQSMKRVCGDTILLVQSMMEYSKVGYSIMKNERIDMTTLVTECFEELRRSNSKRKIVCHIDLLPELYGDKFLLTQAVFNILSNSIKFTKQKPETEVSVWGIENQYETIFSFKDNGVGFDNCYGEKLFLLFNRAHDRADFEGNGIGLATVKRIIERHGGHVEIHGEKDKGCQVLFHITK
jgi:Bacteriophytochrome (light-regulated signal transduction histidine kinase)